MTEADLTAIGTLRQRLWHEGGYRPVALLSHTDPDPERAGKAPVEKAWQQAAQRTPPAIVQFSRALAITANTGIWCGGLRVFDFDIDDSALANTLEELAIATLGAAPTRRRNNSNRFAMLYRAAEGQPGKRSIVSASHTKDHACAIEVLGHGQQLVAYGTHKTGGTIYWSGPEPLDMPVDKLPALTEAAVTGFLTAAATLIGAAPPGQPRTLKPRARVNGEDHDADADDLDPIEDIAAALAAIPNDGPPDFDWWAAMGLRIYAATGGSDEGMALWIEWSAKNPCDGGKYSAETRWRENFATSPPDRSGAGALYSLAWRAKPGWRRPSETEAEWQNQPGGPPPPRSNGKAPKGGQDPAGGQGAAPTQVSPETEGVAENPDFPDPEPGDPRPEPPPHPGAKGGARGELQMVRGTVRPISAIPPRQWAYGKFLLFGSAACIGAMDGAGKGTLATVMAIAMITGDPLLGEKVWRTGPVAIVTYEDDQEEWERRIAAACLHYHYDYETIIGSFYFFHKPGGRVTLAERTQDGLNFPDTARLVHFLKQIGAVLLIIDPFNSAHAMEDGNNNVAIAAVAMEITSIAQQARVAALLLHHLRKSATGTVDDLMGAVALRANFRSVRIMAVMAEGEAVGLGLPGDQHWRYLRLADSKENYAPPLDQAVWYQKVSEDLDNPAGIYDRGDNVAAITRWTPPAAFEGMDYAKLRAVFDALAKPHSPTRRTKAIPWMGRPLIDIAGRSDVQAVKILNLWLDSQTLVEGPPFKTEQRREIRTVVTNPVQVAAILAPLTPPGNPPGTANV